MRRGWDPGQVTPPKKEPGEGRRPRPPGPSPPWRPPEERDDPWTRPEFYLPFMQAYAGEPSPEIFAPPQFTISPFSEPMQRTSQFMMPPTGFEGPIEIGPVRERPGLWDRMRGGLGRVWGGVTGALPWMEEQLTGFPEIIGRGFERGVPMARVAEPRPAPAPEIETMEQLEEAIKASYGLEQQFRHIYEGAPAVADIAARFGSFIGAGIWGLVAPPEPSMTDPEEIRERYYPTIALEAHIPELAPLERQELETYAADLYKHEASDEADLYRDIYREKVREAGYVGMAFDLVRTFGEPVYWLMDKGISGAFKAGIWQTKGRTVQKALIAAGKLDEAKLLGETIALGEMKGPGAIESWNTIRMYQKFHLPVPLSTVDDMARWARDWRTIYHWQRRGGGGTLEGQNFLVTLWNSMKRYRGQTAKEALEEVATLSWRKLGKFWPFTPTVSSARAGMQDDALVVIGRLMENAMPLDAGERLVSLARDPAALARLHPYTQSIAGRTATALLRSFDDRLLMEIGQAIPKSPEGWRGLQQFLVAGSNILLPPRKLDPATRLLYAFKNWFGRYVMNTPFFLTRAFQTDSITILGDHGLIDFYPKKEYLKVLRRWGGGEAMKAVPVPPGVARGITMAYETGLPVGPEIAALGREAIEEVAPLLGREVVEEVGERFIGLSPFGDDFLRETQALEQYQSLRVSTHEMERLRADWWRPTRWMPNVRRELIEEGLDSDTAELVQRLVQSSYNKDEFLGSRLTDLFPKAEGEVIEGWRIVDTSALRSLGFEGARVAEKVDDIAMQAATPKVFKGHMTSLRNLLQKQADDLASGEGMLARIPQPLIGDMTADDWLGLRDLMNVTAQNQMRIASYDEAFVQYAIQNPERAEQIARELQNIIYERMVKGQQTAYQRQLIFQTIDPKVTGRWEPYYKAIDDLWSGPDGHFAWIDDSYTGLWQRIGGESDVLTQAINPYPWAPKPQDMEAVALSAVGDHTVRTVTEAGVWGEPRFAALWDEAWGPIPQTRADLRMWGQENPAEAMMLNRAVGEGADVPQTYREMMQAGWLDGMDKRLSRLDNSAIRAQQKIESLPIEGRSAEEILERQREIWELASETDVLKEELAQLPNSRTTFRFYDYRHGTMRRVREKSGRIVDFEYSEIVQGIAHEVYGFEESVQGAEEFGKLILRRVEATRGLRGAENVLSETQLYVVPETVPKLEKFIATTEAQLAAMMDLGREPEGFEPALAMLEEAYERLIELKAGKELPKTIAATLGSLEDEIASGVAERRAMQSQMDHFRWLTKGIDTDALDPKKAAQGIDPPKPPSAAEASSYLNNQIGWELDMIEEDVLTKWDQGITPEIEQYMTAREYLERRAAPPFEQMKSLIDGMAKAGRDFSLHDYGNRMAIDSWASWVWPWSFWTTHTGAKWVARLMDNPMYAVLYHRYTQNLEEMNKDLPDYWKRTVPLPAWMPFVGERRMDPMLAHPIYQFLYAKNNFPRAYREGGLLYALITAVPMSPMVGVEQLLRGVTAEEYEEERPFRVSPIGPHARLLYYHTGINIEQPLVEGLGSMVEREVIAEPEYLPRWVGIQLKTMLDEGEIDQMRFDTAMSLQEGTDWEEAKRRALKDRAVTETVSFMAAQRARTLVPAEREISLVEGEYYGEILPLRYTEPEEYAERRDDLFTREPWFRSYRQRYWPKEWRKQSLERGFYYERERSLRQANIEAVDTYIRENPGDLNGAYIKRQEYYTERERREELVKFAGLPTDSYYMDEEDFKYAIFGMIAEHLPNAEDYQDKAGTIDWDAYEADRERYWATLPATIIAPRRAYTGTLQDLAMGEPWLEELRQVAKDTERTVGTIDVDRLAYSIANEEAYDEWREANDTPLEAANYTWAKHYRDKAWEDWNKMMEGPEERWDFGGLYQRYPSLSGEDLVDAVMQEYPGRWADMLPLRRGQPPTSPEAMLDITYRGLTFPGFFEVKYRNAEPEAIARDMLWDHWLQSPAWKRHEVRELLDSLIFETYFLDKETREYNRIFAPEWQEWLEELGLPDPWEKREDALRHIYESYELEGVPAWLQPKEEVGVRQMPFEEGPPAELTPTQVRQVATGRWPKPPIPKMPETPIEAVNNVWNLYRNEGWDALGAMYEGPSEDVDLGALFKEYSHLPRRELIIRVIEEYPGLFTAEDLRGAYEGFEMPGFFEMRYQNVEPEQIAKDMVWTAYFDLTAWQRRKFREELDSKTFQTYFLNKTSRDYNRVYPVEWRTWLRKFGVPDPWQAREKALDYLWDSYGLEGDRAYLPPTEYGEERFPFAAYTEEGKPATVAGTEAGPAISPEAMPGEVSLFEPGSPEVSARYDQYLGAMEYYQILKVTDREKAREFVDTPEVQALFDEFAPKGPKNDFWEIYYNLLPPGAITKEIRDDPLIQAILNPKPREFVTEAGHAQAVNEIRAWLEENPEIAGIGNPEEWAQVREIVGQYMELRDQERDDEARALWDENRELLDTYYPPAERATTAGGRSWGAGGGGGGYTARAAPSPQVRSWQDFDTQLRETAGDAYGAVLDGLRSWWTAEGPFSDEVRSILEKLYKLLGYGGITFEEWLEILHQLYRKRTGAGGSQAKRRPVTWRLGGRY